MINSKRYGQHTKAFLNVWRPDPKIVLRVCELLETTYGSPRLGNPQDPLDDLVYIILSNKTNPKVAVTNYNRVKKRFPTWNYLLTSKPEVLRQIIKPGGLSSVKAEQIRGAISKITVDFGSSTLNKLRSMSAKDSEKYLCSLPGISKKVAKCVLMFTMGVQVLPVDSHVFRLAKRLGWTSKNRPDQCYEELEELIPPDKRYNFHVDSIVHGRTVCRKKQPLCNGCSIKNYCKYFQNIYNKNKINSKT